MNRRAESVLRLEAELAELRTYKALCLQQRNAAKRAHDEATAEYNRIRHIVANRARALRKLKEEGEG